MITILFSCIHLKVVVLELREDECDGYVYILESTELFSIGMGARSCVFFFIFTFSYLIRGPLMREWKASATTLQVIGRVLFLRY